MEVKAAQLITKYVDNDYKEYQRIPYGSETENYYRGGGKTCWRCGAKKGQIHLPGCKIEQCPRCLDQYNSCGCEWA